MLLALRHDGDMVAGLHHFVGDHLHLFRDLVVTASHEALDGINGIFGIGDGLPLGDLAHQSLASFGEGDHRGRGAATLFVGDNFGLATLHDGNHRIGGAEVNSDNFAGHIGLLICISA